MVIRWLDLGFYIARISQADQVLAVLLCVFSGDCQEQKFGVGMHLGRIDLVAAQNLLKCGATSLNQQLLIT